MHSVSGSEEERAANARARKFEGACACCFASAFALNVAIRVADKAVLARHGLSARDADECSLLVFIAWAIGGVWCLNTARKIRARLKPRE